MTTSVAARHRPTVRPWHAVTVLDDFALVTWTTDREALAAHLPAGFEPLPVTLDGTTSAAVSLVAFVERDFRFRGLPFARLTCGQVDYRAYVTRGDESGVLFLGTTLDSRLAAIPRVLWSMSMRRAPVDVHGRWIDGALDRLDVRADDDHHGARVSLRGVEATTTPPSDALEPALTDPLVGWYARRNGRVARMSVWHEELRLEPAAVEHATSTLLAGLGLIDEGQPPAIALVTPSTVFDVHTPPR